MITGVGYRSRTLPHGYRMFPQPVYTRLSVFTLQIPSNLKANCLFEFLLEYLDNLYLCRAAYPKVSENWLYASPCTDFFSWGTSSKSASISKLPYSPSISSSSQHALTYQQATLYQQPYSALTISHTDDLTCRWSSKH